MNKFLGEWLNGRATVSKTVGCVFKSRLPCQSPISANNCVVGFFYVQNFQFVKNHLHC